MKIKILLFLLLNIIVNNLDAQLTSANKNALKNRILQKINALRKSKNLSSLEFHKSLTKPAELHSFYMSKTNTLSHFQKNPKYKTPAKRVEHFKPMEYDLIGENILLSSKARFPLSKSKEKLLADEMFKSWKDSPEHFANMIDPNYQFTNIGFELSRTGQIYATQVFVRKGLRIEGQLSDNAFGLTAAYGECEGDMDQYQNLIANIGNSILIEGNDVILYEHNIYYFKKIFSGPNDGIAIDLIEPEQITCAEPNKLDLSPVYDGVLLKPIYRDDILSGNRALSDYRLIAKVGEIPSHLQNKKLILAVIIIRDGVACRYISPSYVSRRIYNLRPIEPEVFDPPNIRFSNTGIARSVTLNYDFKRNATTPLSYPELPASDEKIHSIEIKSFSSIEGNSESNALLHRKRAETIKQHLRQELSKLPGDISISTQENWAHFFFQLKYHFADSLLEKSKAELKKLVVEDKLPILPWDSLLFEQRKSFATIHYEGQLNNIGPAERMAVNLRQAVLDGNIPLANKALFTFYTSGAKDKQLLFEDAVFNALLNEKELVQNAAAALSLVHRGNRQRVSKFISKWIDHSDELSEAALFNLVHLYTILYDQLLKTWDLPAQSLANVIHPKYIESINEQIKNDTLTLNLNLSIIKYYGQINDGPNISRSFNYISKHFKNRITNIESSIDLALFYNYWSMYGLTNQYLLQLFNEDKLNEEALFILLSTLYYMHDSGDLDEYEKIYQKAMELNKTRWCSWISKEIYLLKDQKIKKLYCSECP